MQNNLEIPTLFEERFGAFSGQRDVPISEPILPANGPVLPVDGMPCASLRRRRRR